MEEKQWMKPGMKKEWSMEERRGAVHHSGKEPLCRIKDAGCKGERLEGKWTARGKKG